MSCPEVSLEDLDSNFGMYRFIQTRFEFFFSHSGMIIGGSYGASRHNQIVMYTGFDECTEQDMITVASVYCNSTHLFIFCEFMILSSVRKQITIST
jgi:hypothetical protein